MRPSERSRRRPVRLSLLATASLVGLAMATAPVGFDPSTGRAVEVAEAGNGSERPIETLRPGDRVLGRGVRVNRVRRLIPTRLGNRRRWSIKGSRPFVTAEHPFLASDGWRSTEPASPAAENPLIEVGPIERGTRLVRCPAPAVTAALAAARADRLEPAWREGLGTVQVLLSVDADPDLLLFELEHDGDVRRADGVFCRDCRQTLISAGREVSRTREACRTAGGRWERAPSGARGRSALAPDRPLP